MITISSPSANSTIGTSCTAYGTKSSTAGATGVMRPTSGSGNTVTGTPALATHPNWVLQFSGLTPGVTYELEVTVGAESEIVSGLQVSGP